MRVTKTLAEFAVEPVEAPDALAMMRLSMFDWAACAIAGQGEPVSQILRDIVLAEGGAQEASLVGGRNVPARAAALVNGSTSHALDYDDTHFGHIGHPSVAVVPAALAVAQKIGSNGEALLRACLAGAELSIRVGLWLGRAHYQTGFHQTATAGAFGATAAAGRLLGLEAEQMRHALGLCATRASGLKSQFGTMGQPDNAGIAASNGVECALLARAGLVSNPDGIEAEQGFGATHQGEASARAFAGLGDSWQMENVSHKFHACCHGLHAMLEALADIAVDPATVEAVEITTHPRWLSVCDIAEPATGLEAKFSYRFTAAMALAGLDTAAMGSFTDAVCTRPDLVVLRDRVTLRTDAELAETAAEVTLLVGGVTYQADHDLTMPMTVADRTDRLRAKAAALLGGAQADLLWHATNGPVKLEALLDLLTGND